MVSRASTLALLAVIALSSCGCASVARQEDPRLAFARGVGIIQRHGTGPEGAAGIIGIRRAAHEDLAMAQDRLGLMYLYGNGVKQSTPRALGWLRRAAERGAPAAQLQLGSLYSAGNCAPRNDVRAYYWLSIAATPQASSVHIYNIVAVQRFARSWAQSVARRLTGAQLAAVDRRVVRWAPTPSVPYGGVVVLTHWVCTRPAGNAAASTAVTHAGRADREERVRREYTILRQRFEAFHQQAYGPLSAGPLRLDAEVSRSAIVANRTLCPAVEAAIYGRASALRAMLHAGLNADATVFMSYPVDSNVSLPCLAQAGQRGVIRALLEHGADVNVPHLLAPDGSSPAFEAPLPMAAELGEDDVVRLLLRHGASIDQRSSSAGDDETALAAAVYSENVSTVYLLLLHGADIEAALGPAGTVSQVLVRAPVVTGRMIAIRNLLIEYGARMPPLR